MEAYRDRLKSKISDLRNVPTSDNGLGEAITAALYLSEFVDERHRDWVHLDLYGFAILPLVGDVLRV